MLPSRTATLVMVLVIGLAAPLAIGPAAAQDVTLTVTVINQQSEPISGVQVTATWDDGSVTEQTRASGQALLDVPAGTEVELDVSGASYIRNRPQVIENATTRDVTVPVSEQGQARIVVSDEDGPVQGAEVSLSANGGTAASVQTDDEGVARSGDVEQDNYRLRVRKPGYLEHTEWITVDSVTEHEVTIEEAIVALDVAVQDTHYDPPEEVENASVHIAPTGVRLVTLGNGEASTRVQANRNYEISVSKDGYRNETRTVEVGETDTNLTVNVSLTPAVDLSVAQEAVVVGQSTQVTVTDEYGGAVEDAAITVGGEEVARTNDQGTASVPVETAGDVTIGASHQDRTANVTVEGVQSGGADGGDDGGNQSTDGGIGPGFGPVAALLAVALTAFVLGRHR